MALIDNNLQRYLVEFIGSIILMFIILATGNWLAIGGCLAILVLIGGDVSGGAYNPAVALALYYANKLSKFDVIPYIIAECLGMIVGVMLIRTYV